MLIPAIPRHEVLWSFSNLGGVPGGKDSPSLCEALVAPWLQMLQIHVCHDSVVETWVFDRMPNALVATEFMAYQWKVHMSQRIIEVSNGLHVQHAEAPRELG